MRLSGTQFSADPFKENSPAFFTGKGFSFFRRKIRILVFQFLSGNESQFLRQQFLDPVIIIPDIILRMLHGTIDTFDAILQRLIVAVLFPDDFFPVPLIHID